MTKLRLVPQSELAAAGYAIPFTPRPAVKRRCKTCEAILKSWRQKWPRGVVSPSGIEHADCDYVDGNTACGKDATGEGWWWLL